jgi:carboxypeptidase C (cathepsin A)
MDYTPWLFKGHNRAPRVSSTGEDLGELPPCTFGQPLIDYLNTPKIREQLHIPDYVGDWTMCAGEEQGFKYTMLEQASQWIWDTPDLYNNYRMLKFSGDMDAAVPTIGSLNWINALNRDVVSDWRAWFQDGQVAGYVQQFNGLDFVTVHGAGHMVPQDQRKRAQYMVDAWMSGVELQATLDTK